MAACNSRGSKGGASTRLIVRCNLVSADVSAARGCIGCVVASALGFDLLFRVQLNFL